MLSLAVLNGGRLASGSSDKTIKVWELATGACVATLEGHEDTVFSLAVLEGGRLASGSFDQTVNVWDSARPAVPLSDNVTIHFSWYIINDLLLGELLLPDRYHVSLADC